MSKKYKKQGQKPLPTSTPILPELDEVSAQESVAVIQSVRIDYKRLGIGAMCALLFFLSLCFTAPSTIKVVAITGIVAAIFAIFFRFSQFCSRITIPFLILFAWVLMNGISTLYATSGKFALSEFLKVLISFCGAVLILSFSNGSGQSLGRGAATMLEGGIALVALISIDLLSTRLLSTPVLGLLELFSDDYANLIPVEVGIRMNSLLGNPNIFAGCVGLGVILSLGLAVSSERVGSRRFHLVCLFLNAMGFILAFSMGASGMIMLAFLVYLLLERGERRGKLLVLMVETLIVSMIAAFLVSYSSLTEWTGIQPIPLLCAVAGSGLLCLLDQLLGQHVGQLLGQHGKMIPLLIGALVALMAVFVLLALQLTGPATIQEGETLRRSAYPDAGTYTLSIRSNGNPQVTIESQNRQDTMMHTSTILYQGSAAEASFTVPADSMVVYFNLSGGPLYLEEVTYEGTGGNGKLPLEYKLLPDFIANRLQGLFANQNAIQRLVFFEDGMKLFRRSPVVGLGMGAFENGIASVQSFFYETKYAHNHYVQSLVETGVLGLLLFLAVLVTSGLAVLSSWRRPKDESHPMTAALGAALVFMAGHASVEVIFSAHAYLPIALGVLSLISLCCGASLRLHPTREVVSKWFSVLLAALLAAFAVLLGGNMRAQALVNRSPTFDSLEKAIRLDRFEWADYMLSYVYSAQSLDSFNEDILQQAETYAARLSQVDSNIIPLYLADYYFTMEQPVSGMQMLQKYVSYVAANPETWHSAFQMLRTYQEDTQEYREGILHLAQMLQDWNTVNMGTITLTEDETALIAWAES